MPRLYHPKLDRWIVRNERQADVLAPSGWLREGSLLPDDEEPEDVGGQSPALEENTPDNAQEDD